MLVYNVHLLLNMDGVNITLNNFCVWQQ